MSPETIGRYRILDVLGKGAMGVVYLAHDPVIDRRVALKTLRLDLDAELSAEFRERFLREARAAGRLNHPGIVTIHDVGEEPDTGTVFIAMEYIEGKNLKELLGQGWRPGVTEAARIVAAVADALDYAHRLGVVHRDIKPANIILAPDGTPRITDFGVARLESSNLTVEGQFIGTPNYMSPEQVSGAEVDGRTDIFSLGVVLFELLVGERPFAGNTIAEVTHKIVQQPPPIPSQVAASVPPALNPIVLRCLEKDPGRRFATAGQLARALEAVARIEVRRPAPASDTVAASAETRVGPAPESRPAPPAAGNRLARLRGELGRRWDALPLPEPFRWEVNPRWVAVILGVWILLWAGVLGLLARRVPEGPWPAPSAARVRALHELGTALRRASAALEEGDARAALAGARAVLDQAPASRAAREVAAAARALLEAERRSEATREKVRELVAEGRRLYRKGRYGPAAERFSAALELDPANELAASYLELSQAKISSAPRSRRSRKPAARTSSRSSRTTATRQPVGYARITVFFNSPLNAGTVLVTMDGQTLSQIPFDFTRKGFLGIKKRGTGQVRQSMVIPSGRHTLGVQLSDAQRGPLGFSSFTEEFPAGSTWTLRVDLPDARSEPAFFLVRANR